VGTLGLDSKEIAASCRRDSLDPVAFFEEAAA
jgi:hypothetical protein